MGNKINIEHPTEVNTTRTEPKQQLPTYTAAVTEPSEFLTLGLRRISREEVRNQTQSHPASQEDPGQLPSAEMPQLVLGRRGKSEVIPPRTFKHHAPRATNTSECEFVQTVQQAFKEVDVQGIGYISSATLVNYLCRLNPSFGNEVDQTQLLLCLEDLCLSSAGRTTWNMDSFVDFVLTFSEW